MLMPSVRARRINRSATLKAKHFTRHLPEPVPCSGPLSQHCSRKASFQPVHPVQVLSAGHGLYRLYRLCRMSQRRWYGCNGSPSGTHRDIGRDREPGLVEIEQPRISGAVHVVQDLRLGRARRHQVATVLYMSAGRR